MTTTRLYTFQASTGDPERALRFLEHQCGRFWWYQDPWVKTQDPGISFGFTVAARDQWWCHVRAMKLATGVCEALRLSTAVLSVPVWKAGPPHSNRGYQYLRR